MATLEEIEEARQVVAELEAAVAEKRDADRATLEEKEREFEFAQLQHRAAVLVAQLTGPQRDPENPRTDPNEPAPWRVAAPETEVDAAPEPVVPAVPVVPEPPAPPAADDNTEADVDSAAKE